METRLPLEQPRADTEEEPARKRDLTGVAAPKAVMAPMFAATVAIAAAMAPENCCCGRLLQQDCGEELAMEGGGGGRRILGADRGESEREGGKYTNKQWARRGDGIEWIALESSSSSHWPLSGPLPLAPAGLMKCL